MKTSPVSVTFSS